MDRRALARTFRDRVGTLISARPGGLSRFARETGVDRSALSQLLDPKRDRLPRAETLRAIADSCGVTTDWLLSLSNARSGGHEVAPVLGFEQAFDPGGAVPSERWRAEARGYKLRYVPSQVPHLLLTAQMDRPEGAPDTGLPHADAKAAARLRRTDLWLGDMDVEIAMPVQTLTDLARGARIWTDIPAAPRRAQLEHMAAMVEAHYPTLRLHLYDEQQITTAPYTIFGPIRAVIYLGQSFLVITAAEQVQAIARHFDQLVRRCESGPEAVLRRLRSAAAAVT